MAETQNLPVTDIHSNIGHLATPSRRGHRHKRSFAISGDFEFLKQVPPASVPPLPIYASPETFSMKNNGLENDIPKINFNNDNLLSSPLMPPKLPDSEYSNLLLTPNKTKDLFNTPSPRFFISEEPKFSSPIKGVPDAIINLDDALKTRPRSFKSHRRSESAPAGLEIVFDPHNLINNNKINNGNGKSHNNNSNNQRIDEEEDSSDEKEENGTRVLNDDDDDDGDDTDEIDGGNKIRSSSQGLMSPMRPSSPIFQTISRNSNTSPLKSKLGPDSNDGYNSLKIKGQKQRYYHYTKQFTVPSNPTSASSSSTIPSASSPFNPTYNNSNVNNNLTVRSSGGPTSNTQTQTLKEQPSMSSLSSNVSRTPLSFAYTPSMQQMNTPATPISYSEQQKKTSIIDQHKLNTNTNNNNNTNTTYRIPNKKSWTDQTRRQMSPGYLYRQQGKLTAQQPSSNVRYPSNTSNIDCGSIRSSSNGTPSSFNFESKVYDMEFDKENDGFREVNVNVNDGDVSELSPKVNLNNDLNKLKTKEKNKFTISQDILLGEPGDVVDLSSMGSPQHYDLSNDKSQMDSMITKEKDIRKVSVHDDDGEEEEDDDDDDFDEDEERVIGHEEMRRNVSSMTSLSTTVPTGKFGLTPTIVDRNILITPPPPPPPPPPHTPSQTEAPPPSSSSLAIMPLKNIGSLPNSHEMGVRSVSDGVMQLSVDNDKDVKRHHKRKSRLSVFINNLFK